MRRLQKKRFLEQLDMLCEACNVLKEQPSGSGYVNLCADMQEFVSAILDFLEHIAGEGTETAGLLCEFYKMLFKASQGEATASQLLSQVGRISARAGRELKPDKIEVAFFCYKASMSDCLESVYFAAKEDSACHPYFIPIPYYDRNPDGSLGQMHYEAAGCYSDKYELTDWQNYDVEARRPDIVYIMAPFDEYNFVTSVHPDFYARRLRKYTDLLIYIPYIVHSEVVDASVGGFPGVLYAHRVIVQSENVRKQYISSILSRAPGLTPERVEEKIVALGSPKTDKVLRSKKTDYSIPQEWINRLKPDASEKLVLLYNLSIETALNHSGGEKGDRYLNKLRSVFRFFENRRDVVLWWRPHPLLDQTFRSMRPRLYQEYRSIVDDYMAQRQGIYDDSADMNRAIAYADACYGDESSLNLLLQFAGKPILIQNMYNAGMEPETSEGAEAVEKAMDAFVAKQHYNSYILYEVLDASKGGFSLAGFMEHMDIIMKRGVELSAKYRLRYANADGTAGQKIYEYTSSIVRRMDDE